nr:MAG TPA: hypothetical protein [Caudoviricetes sp.]
MKSIFRIILQRICGREPFALSEVFAAVIPAQ